MIAIAIISSDIDTISHQEYVASTYSIECINRIVTHSLIFTSSRARTDAVFICLLVVERRRRTTTSRKRESIVKEREEVAQVEPLTLCQYALLSKEFPLGCYCLVA